MSMSKAPVSGNKYRVKDVKYDINFLTNSKSSIVDGNPITAETLADPPNANQLWVYLEYPSTNNNVIFTLQCVSTLEDRASTGGRGGYMSVDSQTGKLVQSGTPFAWRRVEHDELKYKYKFHPAYDTFSDRLIVTDETDGSSVGGSNQATLENEGKKIYQLWSFE